MTDDKKYYGIDILRVISCICIIMMHMLANNKYELNGFFYKEVIPSFTNFVFLFMTISAFGLCCGYYDKVMDGSIIWGGFYKKRYVKILPFFSCLVFIDLIAGFSKESLFEAIADISLLYGLFPNDISVIGVGWFLGVIFAFYIIFPFFCVLIESKKRAWISFVGSLILNYICGTYFDVERQNIIYCLCFFIAGGIIYLYKDGIARVNSVIAVIIPMIVIVLYYLLGGGVYMCLAVSVSLLICATAVKFTKNTIIHFLSSISMEMYLSHMMIFRFIEKLHLNTLLGNGLLQYFVTTVLVISGTIVFSVLMQTILKYLEKRIVNIVHV